MKYSDVFDNDTTQSKEGNMSTDEKDATSILGHETQEKNQDTPIFKQSRRYSRTEVKTGNVQELMDFMNSVSSRQSSRRRELDDKLDLYQTLVFNNVNDKADKVHDEILQMTDVAPSSKIEEMIKTHFIKAHLQDLQRLCIWDYEDEIDEKIKFILSLTDMDSLENLQKAIDSSKIKGAEMRRSIQQFVELVSNDPFSPEGFAIFDNMVQKYPQIHNRMNHVVLNKMYSDIQKIESMPKVRNYLECATKQYPHLINFAKEFADGFWTEADKHEIDFVNHQIWMGEPHLIYELYVDGVGFPSEDDAEGYNGCIVGVVVPEDSPLKFSSSNPPWKDMDGEAGQKSQFVKEILSSDCGIIGIMHHPCNPMNRTAWNLAVSKIVTLTQNLLPRAKNGFITLKVKIRRHWNKNDKEFEIFQKTIREATLSPTSNTHIIVEFDNGEGQHRCEFDAALAMAASWGGSDVHLKTLIACGGLINTCLIEYDGEIMSKIDSLLDGVSLSDEQWIELNKLDASANNCGSILSHAIDVWTDACKDRTRYFDITMRYAKERSDDLDLICAMANRLSKDCEESSLPLSIQFFKALYNLHSMLRMDDVDPEEIVAISNRINDMSKILRIHSQSFATHAFMALTEADIALFDFAQASERIKPWNPYSNGALPESDFWSATLLSQMGKICAMNGDFANAHKFFNDAITKFNTMPKSASTQKYLSRIRRLIALLSIRDFGIPPRKCKEFVEMALDSTIDEAVADFGKYPEHSDVELHLILARYLSMYGTKSEKDVYFENSSQWIDSSYGAGHPWELIQYFRAIMADGDLRLRLFSSIIGCVNWNTCGAKVKLIIFAICRAMGLEWNNAFLNELDKILYDLPLASERVELIRDSVAGDSSIPKKVLPFIYC